MSVSIFYIVEPPRYASMSALLLVTLRKYVKEDVKVIGYCPQDQLAEIPQSIRDIHAQLGAEIRGFRTADRWETPYPHGNKLLAALDDRGTEFSLFLDSDIVFVQPVSIYDYVGRDVVCASAATTIGWGGDEEWARIYGHLDMPIPETRINLSRRRKRFTFMPYFNAGMIGFPERLADGRRFAELWYDIARKVDTIPDLDARRPYLDQIALPAAIQASGLSWRSIDEDRQYILGGRIRGKPLPRTTIAAIHYRYPEFLSEIGESAASVALLQNLIGDADIRDLLTDPNWFDAAPAP